MFRTPDRLRPETSQLTIGENNTVSFTVFRSRHRRRTVAFKIESDGSLRVLAPYAASIASVTKILQKRASWIAREMAQREQTFPCNAFMDGSFFSYLGYECILRITQGAGKPQSCHFSPWRIHVHVPDDKLSPENLREEVRLEILLWIKKRARRKFKKRLDLWAARMGVPYQKLLVTDPERRWGSCSVDNVIRLNWRLMMAPLPMLDYVAAHELAHVRHKNHSPRFWAFLERVIPDWKVRRKALRKMEGGLVL
jgi:predicted metal-dependent hydrolase